MTSQVLEAFELLAQREARKDAAVTSARQLYAQSALGDVETPGGGQALVAAMDELRLCARDLKHDAEVASAARKFHGEVAKAIAGSIEANKRLREATDALDALNPNDPTAAELRTRASSAEHAVAHSEQLLEVLGLSMRSCLSKSPRLFPGGVVPPGAFASVARHKPSVPAQQDASPVPAEMTDSSHGPEADFAGTGDTVAARASEPVPGLAGAVG